MRKLSFFLIFSLFTSFFYGQGSYDPNNPPNTFQNPENPLYWKNKKPYADYWQQDVFYVISAKLDDQTNVVTGSEDLTYWNNSPDEIRVVYFYLYNNAQIKGSYLSNLYENNNYKLKYGKYQEQGLGCVISKITINGVELETELENTVMKVRLPSPLRSGQSITFNIDFKTYFDNGTIRNRMKVYSSYGKKHFDLVHWYPRIAVYDHKFGWFTDQHGDHEFYGDFGTFDVQIALPNNYIVDATGNLLNRDEVLPEELRKKLDIKNFADKKWNSPPSEIIAPDGTYKNWHFYSENVHDFALTADPLYRIGEDSCKLSNGKTIKCYSFAQEHHASRWQNAASYTAKIIQFYSENIGYYEYPKMSVADANDGMEYPMLTLDNGSDPSYRDLLAHEIGHNWFFGMVGNNETYRAFLDEGFTQFIEVLALESIDGPERVVNPSTKKYEERLKHPDLLRNTEIYDKYISDVAKSEDASLNTHSDGYKGAIRHGGGYGMVYRKSATMLFNLQYVLGKELFEKAFKNYFNQWKFCHPYQEDFRNSIINYTKVDLNWFFDEWIDATKKIDYAIGKIKKGTEKDEYLITFKRKGDMQMPIDFTVVSREGKIYNYQIPNSWYEKKTTATTLPRWIGWDKTKPTYTVKVIIPEGIAEVRIDTTNRMADVNMLNNSNKLPVKHYFDSRLNHTPDWTSYEVYGRPDIWYNGYDGLKFGFHMNGNYLNYFHVFDANVWLNTGWAQAIQDTSVFLNRFNNPSFRVNYKTATDKFMKHSSISIGMRYLDGLNLYALGFEKISSNKKNIAYVLAKAMFRASKHDLNYLLNPGEWAEDKLNSTITIGLKHIYTYSYGSGLINLYARSSAFTRDYDYSHITLTAINKNNLWRFKFNSRFIAQYGTGSRWASESSLYAAGANAEEMMENKYVRSQGFFSQDWSTIGATTNNFQYGGGLNLRGYTGYLMPEILDGGEIRYTYKGTSGTALNTEFEFDELIRLMPKKLRNTLKVNSYLFADAGFINYSNNSEVSAFGSLRADAGIGTALTIKKFGSLQKVEPLTIRFDMPLFLNRTPAIEPDFIQFRWVISVERAF